MTEQTSTTVAGPGSNGTSPEENLLAQVEATIRQRLEQEQAETSRQETAMPEAERASRRPAAGRTTPSLQPEADQRPRYNRD